MVTLKIQERTCSKYLLYCDIIKVSVLSLRLEEICLQLVKSSLGINS